MNNIRLFDADTAIAKAVNLTPTSLTLVDELSAEQTDELWRRVAIVRSASQFWIGDLWNQHSQKYGDRDEFAERHGLEPKTVSQFGWVCGKVRSSLRREDLEFGHHKLVASMEPEEQEKWLGLAVIGTGTKEAPERWSVAEMRHMIRDGGGKTRDWLQLFNVWNFSGLDTRFGSGHPGNIPGQVNQNLNYYLTEPGDLIVDLFAGGGTTLDVCTYDDNDFGNRRCLGFDIRPMRNDITQWDVLGQGFPRLPDDVRLIFLDPPYWKQKRGEYSDDPNNLANLELPQFYDALCGIVEKSRSIAEYTALIIGPTQKGHEFEDHSAVIMGRMGKPHLRIIVPYSTQQYTGAHVNQAKDGRFMLNLHRDLMIWQRN